MLRLKTLKSTAIVAGLIIAGTFGFVSSSSAKEITIRIASGHPPTVVYAGLMKNFFQPEVVKAVKAKTGHTVKFIEGYSGSIVKVFDTFEGVQNGVACLRLAGLPVPGPCDRGYLVACVATPRLQAARREDGGRPTRLAAGRGGGSTPHANGHGAPALRSLADA